MYRLILFVLILINLLSVTMVQAFDLEGHRGARAIYPENTLKAFEYAISVGVNTLEMDMQVTRDREIVISHDPYITAERCLDSKGESLREKIAIHSLTLKRVQSYDCGSVKNPRFPKQQNLPQKMPTLDEVFHLVEQSKLPQAAQVNFNIETKIVPQRPELSPTPSEFVDLFLAVVRRHKMTKRCILQSFDHRTLVIAKKKEPTLRIAALIAENFINLKLIATDLHAEIISPHYDWITAEAVKDLHEVGVKVIPWTVDEPDDWKKTLALGVDGLITDDPQAFKDFQSH
jgi:glycerophosphoryl diester phosphodiesterase